jgi:hypothetical protein
MLFVRQVRSEGDASTHHVCFDCANGDAERAHFFWGGEARGVGHRHVRAFGLTFGSSARSTSAGPHAHAEALCAVADHGAVVATGGLRHRCGQVQGPRRGQLMRDPAGQETRPGCDDAGTERPGAARSTRSVATTPLTTTVRRVGPCLDRRLAGSAPFAGVARPDRRHMALADLALSPCWSPHRVIVDEPCRFRAALGLLERGARVGA